MCRLCGLNCRARPSFVYSPDPRPEVEEHPERESARDAVDDARGDRVVEAEAHRQPAARAPAPRRVEDPDGRAEDRREHEVGREPRPLDDRAGHDRGRRPAEEQERQEEDQVDVVREVRTERVAPGDAALAGGGGEVGAVRADRQPGLVAVVDPPAEVVERRRHHGDREDVLHRRRHHVLAPRDAGLIGHEARMDQPHQDDGEEVELLREDRAVAGELLGTRRFCRLREDRCQHCAPPRSPHASNETCARRGSIRDQIGRAMCKAAIVWSRVMWRAYTTPQTGASR